MKRPGLAGDWIFSLGRTRALIVGMSVTETMSERPTEQLIASAMSRKSWPASSSTNRTGRKTASVVNVEARTAPQTSCAPLMAAWYRRSPRWMCR